MGISQERLERLTRFTHDYVDDGKLPGVSTVVAHRGEVVYRDVYGMADIGAGKKLSDDSIFRIYSMTKPPASIACMILYEEGRLLLEDPIAAYIPAFEGVRVYDGPARGGGYATVEAKRPPTIRDLLTHTSGITAAFQADPVAEIYRRSGLARVGSGLAPAAAQAPKEEDLAGHCDRLGTMPLLFHPGTRWQYGSSTDVVGRVIEVVSGQPLDAFMSERIFEPLGMVDTGFWVLSDKLDRFCANYARRDGELVQIDASDDSSAYAKPPAMLSGAGGLTSTVDDYRRFTGALLRNDGTVIGPRTLRYMTTNHLPGGADLATLGGSATFSEATMGGMGFGLGFSVMLDPAANQGISSVGEFAWGGAASTAFWVDPSEELEVVFMTQLLPSATYPIRRQLKATIYQALVD